jgi:hypothetical protein
MEETTCAPCGDTEQPVSTIEEDLTAVDRERLTFFKWRYVLQADGFAVPQARRLTFIRWLYLQGRITE